MTPDVDAFHRRYYNNHNSTWTQTRWLGHRVLKCPLDLWIYQEILAELRPSLVIETGTMEGGSAMFLASMCDTLGHGKVVSVDINAELARPAHPRITYLAGSSVAPEILGKIRDLLPGDDGHVVVILDSDHRRPHVLAELHAYAPIVTSGSYMIVEDTNLNGHPVVSDFGPGPAEAVNEFLATGAGFARDLTREKFMMTFNPGGYLRKA